MGPFAFLLRILIAVFGLMFHHLWSPVNAMAAGFLGPCALCDEHHTAIPLVNAGNVRHNICTPIDV